MRKIQLFFIITLISCSSPIEVNDEIISILKTNDSLRITNNSNQVLYLFIVEQKIAALINWAPHFDNPKVSTYNSIDITYKEIYNGKSEPVKSGDKIIVYVWDKSNQSSPDIHVKIIEL